MPRWAFALYWRRDGKPMWRDAALIAREGETSAPTADDARRLAEAIAQAARHRGGARAAGLRGPAALDAGGSAGFRSMSTCAIRNCSMPRRAPAWCARSSAGSAHRPATCCRCAATDDAWASEAWDDAARASVPAARRSAGRVAPAARRAAARRTGRLSDRRRRPIRWREAPPLPDAAAAEPKPAEDAIVRTALAVEPRDGRLNVFMPFVGTLEDYLGVLAAVEAAAAAARSCRCTSKAMRRRSTRASTSSR